MTTQTVAPCAFSEGHCIHCGDSQQIRDIGGQCEGWVEPEFLEVVKILKIEIAPLKAESDAWEQAHDEQVAKLIEIANERDALMESAKLAMDALESGLSYVEDGANKLTQRIYKSAIAALQEAGVR